VVDDDHALRRIVTAWVESFGFESSEADTADDALASLEAQPAEIALCDVNLGGADGVWLASQIRERHPRTAIIMASQLRDVDLAISSLQNDVIDYLLKPFDRDRLAEALSLAHDWHLASTGLEQLQHAIEGRVRNRRAAVAATLAELQDTHEDAADGLIDMLQLHERDGRGHAQRVARLTMALADELGINEGSILELYHGALLHDIGKLEIPVSILRKPALLDADEWKVMRTHPQAGYDLLQKLPRFAGAAEIVVAHHEAFNGGGYPRGLKGESIPVGARVLAVADAYDSMTMPHTQRPPLPPAMAVEEIERCSGSQFDPDIAAALGDVLVHAVQEQVA
jgi:response regulator RpfG family c-di-GMP phosphodiesterase